MSGVELPSHGRTRSEAVLAKQDPFLARVLQSEGPKDDELLESNQQLRSPLSSHFKDSEFGSRRGLRKQSPDSDEGGRVAASRYPSPPKGNNNLQSLQNARDSGNTPDQRDYILDLADPDRITSIRRQPKLLATFQCTLCPKKFARAYNLRSHLRTHTDERPFVCTICSKAFARQHDRKRHEGLHSGEKKFVCRGVSQGSVSASWGCGRRFARADALGRHFRSEEGRVCIKPLLDEEAVERQKAWLEEWHLAGLVTPRPMTTAPYHDHMNNFLPAALLLQYPALAGLDWNSLPRGPPPDEEAYSGRSSFDASSGGESQDEILDQLVAPLGQSLDILRSALGPTQSHPSTVAQSLPVLTPSPGTIKDNEFSGSNVDQPDDHNSPLGSPQVVSGTTGMFQQHFVGLESRDLTPATTTMQSHDPIPPHMHRPPQSPSRYGSSISRQASSQNFGHVDRSLATSGSLDSSSAAYPQEVGDKWLGMGGYRHRRLSSDHLSDISSPHNSPYLSTLNSFDHFSPMLNPSADPTFSDGLGPLGLSQLSLNNGDDATQSLYGLGYSPHISSRLIPQQNGLPAFTADNNFGMVLEHSGQFMQPNDGPEIVPIHGQNSSRFPSVTPSQKSESKIRELQVAPIVVPQARDDASPRRFSDDEHSRINGTAERPNSDFLLANPMWSHEARSVDLNDPSAAWTDMAASTAQTASEDANTFITESIRSDYCHPVPPQSPCEKDLATADLDEHEMTETTTRPPLVRIAAPSFGEARSKLELLRLGIATLEDSSESSSDISRGEPDLLTDSQYLSQADSVPDTTDPPNDTEEGVEGHDDYRGSSQVDTGSSHDTGTLHSSAQEYSRKRQRHHGINDGYAHLGVCLGEKGSRSTCKRFVCCFQHGPGRNCPGTDETVSEVLKKLSEHHDTHVCDRCWVLKVKDKSSGLLVHPDDVLDCLDYCLSPQCHRTTPTIGHRHRFDQGTCKTKTSRVRPGDGEAVYRFIFSLVHPTLESPVEVVTAEHALHLGAVPRQGRRKATREELTAQADRLGRRLEDLERQHIEGTDQVNRLKQELSDAHSNAERDRVKTASLEAKLRRVVAILGDALRTGEFRDQQGHRSLLMRVGEDAPDALSLFSHPSPSPPESTTGQQPSFLPTREKTNATAECQLFQNAYPMIANSAALDKTPHSNSLEIRTSQVPTMGVNVDDQEMEIDWLNLLDESGNKSNISAYLDGFS